MIRLSAIVALTMTFFACGGSEPVSKPAPPPKAEMPAKAEKKMEKKADAHGAHGDHGGDKAVGAFKALEAGKGKVFFVEPADGATVKSPVKVVFGAEGVAVVPAGQMKDNSGHHHIIIDGAVIAPGTAVPADDTHIHFGGGQTETEVELKPGKHTLTMQFADFAHRSYGEPYSAQITVTVEE
jgi:hypothetical protein